MRGRKWTEAQLKEAVASAKSIRSVLQILGLKPAGGNYVQIVRYIQELKISSEHFTGKVWNKGLKGIGKPRLSLSEILVNNSYYQSFKLKTRLFNEKIKEQRCEMCGWAQKAVDGRIPLELDHINGNRMDNRLENLRILCPNCHSLQPTHRGLNKKIKK